MTDKKSIDRMPAPNTAEAASLYQRLRGHLAVLKLHDAAEALPSVLPSSGLIRLSLYNILGREVMPLLNNQFNSGTHSFSLIANGLSSGTYLVKLESDGESAVRKVVLLK